MRPPARTSVRAIAIGCAVAAIAPAAAVAQDAGVEALGAFVRRAQAEAGVRGVAVARIQDGRVLPVEAFGVRDQRSREPVTSATVFAAASLGKVVAAYAALLRVQDGDWDLAMPVSSERMSVAPGCRPPTLAMLLSHTAGLGNDLRAARFEPACRPPAPFAYAGQGYLVLQELFGDASGQAAEAFIHARVFEPLEMATATYAPPRGANVATGHADPIYAGLSRLMRSPTSRWATLFGVTLALVFGGEVIWRSRRRVRVRTWLLVGIATGALGALGIWLASLVFVPVEPWDQELRLPSSLSASAEDLGRFAAELLEPRLARPEVRDLLFAEQTRIDDELGWGAGIGIEHTRQAGTVVTSYWQWGSNPGFQSLLVLVPEHRAAIVVLTNTGGFLDSAFGHRGGYRMAKRVARHALGIDARWDLHRPAPG